MKKHYILLVAGVLLVSLALPAAGDLAPGQPYGEVVNGSVELTGDNNQPLNWSVQTVRRRRRNRAAARQGNRGATVDSAVAHDGSRSLLLDASSGRAPAWRNRTFVKPYAQYRFTGWVKTENVQAGGENQGAGFTFQGMEVESPPPMATGTQDWTKVEVTFNTGGQDSFSLQAVLGRPRGRRGPPGGDAGSVSGKAWFDDMKLELLSGGDTQPKVTIDAAQTGKPMNDMVYGQFIEHLGRCIYGGIWAEMLQDRKFYSAVGETRRTRQVVPSPWRVTGRDDALTMITEGTFVGEHTPEIDLGDGGTPTGIIQSPTTPAGRAEEQRVANLTRQGAEEIPDLGPGLGIVEGKGYEGYVILAGDATAAPIEVSLIWGESSGDRQTVVIDAITSDYKKYAIQFTAGTTTDTASFEIIGKGRGKFRIGPPSLMPKDNVKGMRADTLALLKELDSPIYRWPGGNFVSGYDWKDGIGERDRRPPRKNPAWRGIESNDFGMHEFFAFLAEVDSKPFIALNAGLGSAKSAAEELQYVNGPADTPMGKLRVANGGPTDPWNCTYWAVGNEMSGSWQLGNVPLEEFIKRHNEFSALLMKVDPSIKLIASGEAANPNVNRWDQQLLAGAAKYLHLNSKHFYRQDYSSAGGLMSHARQIGDSVRAISASHRTYLETIPEVKGTEITVSLDEWNYWYGPHVFGELGTRYFLRDAIGMAAGINEYSRNADVIEIACVAQTVNVIGAIKTDKTAAVMDSIGETLVMYRRHFGYIPVKVSGSPEPLDVAATWTKDKSTLTISVVNMTWEPQTLTFEVKGADLGSNGKAYILTAEDDMAYNQPGEEKRVKFTETTLSDIADKLEVLPVSATVFRLPAN